MRCETNAMQDSGTQKSQACPPAVYAQITVASFATEGPEESFGAATTTACTATDTMRIVFYDMQKYKDTSAHRSCL